MRQEQPVLQDGPEQQEPTAQWQLRDAEEQEQRVQPESWVQQDAELRAAQDAGLQEEQEP